VYILYDLHENAYTVNAIVMYPKYVTYGCTYFTEYTWICTCYGMDMVIHTATFVCACKLWFLWPYFRDHRFLVWTGV